MPSITKLIKNIGRGHEIARCISETSEWAGISLAFLGLSRLVYPHVLRLRSGEQIILEEVTDVKAFWQVFLRRVYRVDAADCTILDLGANVGMFTLYAARCAPQARIFAVEPFPSTFDRLASTVRDHNLGDRVTCLNYAVAASAGTLAMLDAGVPSQRRALIAKSSTRTGTPVAGKTLEALLDESNLHRVDLMKMDVEGSEYEILLSTSPKSLSRIRRIAMEYHGDCEPYSKQELFSHLRRAGFAVNWDLCDALGYGLSELTLQS